MKKNELTPDNLAEFKNRFGTLHDGIIHSVEYLSFGYPKQVNLMLGLIDGSTLGEAYAARNYQLLPENWINVRLEIVDIETVAIAAYPNYLGSCSVIFEAHIAFFDGSIHFNFHPLGKEDDPETYKVVTSEASCDLIIIGKKCFWSTLPYSERQAR